MISENPIRQENVIWNISFYLKNSSYKSRLNARRYFMPKWLANYQVLLPVLLPGSYLQFSLANCMV